jgi:hypothetical protein
MECDRDAGSFVVRDMEDGVRCPTCGSAAAIHATRVISADGPFLNCRCDRCERDWKVAGWPERRSKLPERRRIGRRDRRRA